MWKKLKARFKALEPYVALFCTIAALSIAVWQIYETRKAAEAQSYLEMRQRYYEAAQALQGYDDILITRKSPHWKHFKNYWYISFDEWYVTRKLGVFPDLWETYYSEAFVRALNKQGMNAVFCDLRKTDFRDGIRGEFVKELEETYRSRSGGKGPCT